MTIIIIIELSTSCSQVLFTTDWAAGARKRSFNVNNNENNQRALFFIQTNNRSQINRKKKRIFDQDMQSVM